MWDSESQNKKKEFLKVSVSGKNKEVWSRMRGKLMQAVEKFLDTTLDYENSSTIKDEARKFSTALLDHAKEKLAKTGIENQKMLAEIDLMFSTKTKELAETRKINAEAQAIEFSNSVKQLKLTLGLSKALIIGEQGEENVVFIKQIDSFLEVIQSVEADNEADQLF